MSCTTRIKVRGYHEDRFGHVNNARYLEFLEEGRWDYLDRRGPQEGFQSLGVIPVVAHLSISYHRPTSAGDKLTITTRVTRSSSRKIVMNQTIHQDESEKLCCQADITIVLVDAKTGRSAVLNEEILGAWPDLASAGDHLSSHPNCTSKKHPMRFHHIGIPTTEPKPGETYSADAKLFITDIDSHPYRVEWLRFEAASPMPELIQKIPHVAFEVDDLESAIEGKEVIHGPLTSESGVQLAFIVEGGAPVEFMEKRP